uniref:Uncharacterized protein n=1 Tax=Kalmanozyma brasiliensis (strain GHG001) TaxID=1365824 RepID=V5ET26_KALBG
MLTPSSSTDDLDVALLEGLERHELEQLLIEASRKMREREHKLVVAANIGKALLEKNLSLRSGIMTSMESSSNLFGLSDIEAMIHDFASTQNTDAAHMLRFGDARTQTGPSSPQPMNSPPTTDIDINSQCENSPERPGSDITPLARPVSLPDTDDDYFSRPADSTATQNISELQHEAESARFEGSKKLSRLNKELRGLKAELEAATTRNVELENGESALLAQLLAKIKELEETNSAMAKAEEDFGSRMGRAMQEDERLRDALTTVGQDLGIAATSSTTASPEKGLHNSCSRIESDRPTAHVGRLVPRCDEEHEDDLECVLTQSAYGQIEEAFLDESLVHPRDAALFARVEDEEQGAWLADQPIIETGGLQDEDEPRSSQFDLINAVVEHQAVAWADDDDYGRNITQREAAKLGLLARSALLQAGRGARLLTGATRNSNSAFGTMTKAHEQRQGAEKPPPARFEIESAEQVEHRLRIEALLRRRRQQLLRERGYPEQWEPARKEEDELVAMYAPSPQRLQERRMQALVGGRGSSTATSPGDASPSQRDPRRSTQQWVRELACVSPTVKKRSGGVRDQNLDLTTLDDVRPEEAEFELLDCPTWKKQGGRGTDYFPTSFRARYRPTMVKQRVAHVSQLTYGWVEEWIQFAFVVFLAFVVMIEQGPNRNARRGKAGAAPQRIMN